MGGRGDTYSSFQIYSTLLVVGSKLDSTQLNKKNERMRHQLCHYTLRSDSMLKFKASIIYVEILHIMTLG